MHQHPAKSTSAHVGHVPPINGQAVVHPLRRRIRQLLDRHRPQRLALAVKVLLRQRWWTRRRLLHENQQAQTDTAVRIRQACNPLLATRTLPLAAPPPALVCLRRGGWGGRCIVGSSTTVAGPRQGQGRPQRATHEGIKPAPLNWLAPASKPPPPYMLLAIGAVGGLSGGAARCFELGQQGRGDDHCCCEPDVVAGRLHRAQLLRAGLRAPCRCCPCCAVTAAFGTV